MLDVDIFIMNALLAKKLLGPAAVRSPGSAVKADWDDWVFHLQVPLS